MCASTLFRIILNKDDIRKINIDCLPETLDEFMALLKHKLGIEDDLIVQYEDKDFENELCNLTNLSDLPEGRATLKVTVKNSTESHHTDSTSDTGSLLSSPSSHEDTSHRRKPWPEVFEIPRFSYDVDLLLRRGNEAYQKDGTLLNIRKDTKSDILDVLAEKMYSYNAYPSREEYDIVAQSLIKRHPCLREPGSSKGWYSWKFSLKFKMGNYRNKLRMAGCPELQVNSRPLGPKQKLKRAKKAEINFLPALPEGTTRITLEEERLQIEEMKKKRAEMKKIEEMMANTFSLRRKQIVEEEPPVSEVKMKWPALFTEQQIKAEFNRITSTDLTECFYAGLDQHLPRLLQLYRTKMERFPSLKNILSKLENDNSTTMKRAVTLRGLPYFLSEDPSGFLKTAEATEPEERMTQGVNVGLIFVRDGVDPLDIAVVLENQILLHDIDDLSKAMAMLTVYVLNIDY